MLSVTTFDCAAVAIMLMVILLIWITIVLTRDRQDPLMKYMKEQSIVDGLVSRKLLAEIISEAIRNGTWSP